ncbi:MAG: hypothetical protein K5Q68_20830, partial [Roseococcus sp.]|nr:hypothetical protein [Roseococcus sp.]
PAPPRAPGAASPTPAMMPRTPAPSPDQAAPPIRRTDARDGIAMPRLVLAPIPTSPEPGRAAR